MVLETITVLAPLALDIWQLVAVAHDPSNVTAPVSVRVPVPINVMMLPPSPPPSTSVVVPLTVNDWPVSTRNIELEPQKSELSTKVKLLHAEETLTSTLLRPHSSIAMVTLSSEPGKLLPQLVQRAGLSQLPVVPPPVTKTQLHAPAHCAVTLLLIKRDKLKAKDKCINFFISG